MSEPTGGFEGSRSLHVAVSGPGVKQYTVVGGVYGKADSSPCIGQEIDCDRNRLGMLCPQRLSPRGIAAPVRSYRGGS